MKALENLLRQTEFHTLIFFFFLVLAGWPFLSAAGAGGVVGLFTYLLLIWGVLIFILFLINRSLAKQEDSEAATVEYKGGEGDV